MAKTTTHIGPCKYYRNGMSRVEMQSTKLGLSGWAIVIHLMTKYFKGRVSMRLHRERGISQKAAWHLAHRLREAPEAGWVNPLARPVEVDETYIRDPRKKRHSSPNLTLGRGPLSTTAVVGATDQETMQVSPRVIPDIKDAWHRHSLRELHTVDQMRVVPKGLEGKRLRSPELVA